MRKYYAVLRKLLVLLTAIVMILLLIPVGVEAAEGNYSIHYNANATNCTGETADQLDLVYDVANKLNANGFSREGYQFAGWKTNPEGTGDTIPDQASYDVYKGYIADNTLTLYAQWQANKTPSTVSAPAPAAVSSVWIPSFVIRFLDCTGKIISDQWVAEGQPAAIPSGYSYAEEELNWVYRNLTVSPIGCKVSGFTVPDTADRG